MTQVTINIDMGKKCRKCKKKGTLPSGLCLNCVSKMIQCGELDHVIHDSKGILQSAADACNHADES